ncbi:PTS transporter subunit EIIC [Paramaledivibacter caminithermalis]|jgi:PTS system maltose and glucose-specific IIC component|uniref:PTS system, maltose and glucose-specific IIC component n=1 Tax=Paramaledivibacter caminithermalis (strain DSM 15212 / CIP 107654 / DViRD3) TaxID=1121301 RepID=A0A1M6K7U6_PARC5|nr:PTS transporter subunit EIIC [Paramaledivibacter caminithermalis]SHJ54937.1 PTS system, maltose and glucose-specific IIC component [Paramaledivibacter caminithermalis DSM 15212]
MREKLQSFAGSMMVPIILLVLVGFYVSIACSFTGYILTEGTFLHTIFSIFADIGFMIMRYLPFWFAIGVAFGLAKKEKGWAAFAGFVMFMCFNTVISTYAGAHGWNVDTTTVDHLVNNLGWTMEKAQNYNALWKNIAGIFTFDMGIFSGIITGIATAAIHNKWCNKELPTVFSFFSGPRYVIILITLFSIPLGIVTYYVWPIIAAGLQGLTKLITTSGLFGTFLFGAMDKALLPFGIHHLIAFPIEYTRVGGTMEIGGIVYEGVRNIIVGQAGSPEATGYIVRNFTTGRILFQFGGLPGAAAAIYAAARPENKKKVASIVVPAALTVMFVGISEPIEYTFLFVNPLLYYLIHVPLAGLAYILTEVTKVSINGHALFFMIPNLFQPHKVHAMSLFILVPVYFAAYFFLFKWAILKFDIPTPGRSGNEKVKLYTKSDYKEKQKNKKEHGNDLAYRIVENLGGANNIDSVSNCATRLRVTVKDASLVSENSIWVEELEAHGVVRNNKGFQIIYGPRVISIATAVKDVLNADSLNTN